MQDLNNENTVPTQPDHGIGETAPVRVQPERQAPVDNQATVPVQPLDPAFPVPPKRKVARAKRWPWIIVGILLVILFAGAGGWAGFQSAIQLRNNKAASEKIKVATEHFMIGLQLQNNKQFEFAQKQFEYVIGLDPNFPGAQDKLREVLISQAVKASATPVPTVAQPTLTPTLDLRPQEEILNTARQQYANQQWDDLFATIDSLRRIDRTYHAVEIDDMIYMALRFRGVDKILHQANLEGGLYDLALAEQYGPLDVDAKGYRNWARLYLNGASFWEVDWLKVMQAFEQIYPYFPNMTDSSHITAIERYRIAARSYADKLMADGDACGAYDYYEKSLNAVADNQLAATATAVYLVCHPPEPTSTPTPQVTATAPAAPTSEATTPVVVPTETSAPPPPEKKTATPEPPAPTAEPATITDTPSAGG